MVPTNLAWRLFITVVEMVWVPLLHLLNQLAIGTWGSQARLYSRMRFKGFVVWHFLGRHEQISSYPRQHWQQTKDTSPFNWNFVSQWDFFKKLIYKGFCESIQKHPWSAHASIGDESWITASLSSIHSVLASPVDRASPAHVTLGKVLVNLAMFWASWAL